MTPTRKTKARAPLRKKSPAKKRARGSQRPATGLEFNHAMIYVTRMDRSIAFYRDVLGFRLIEEYPGAYARLRSPKGGTTIALHVIGEHGERMDASVEGMRLYFESRQLDSLCRRLVARGVRFKQLPQDMPWGWRHAYLHDPDGHEISLYHAGRKRYFPTRMP
jgi:catechol 2,3-dioxygenase-like lactoylglutathione lyase family enzyme